MVVSETSALKPVKLQLICLQEVVPLLSAILASILQTSSKLPLVRFLVQRSLSLSSEG